MAVVGWIALRELGSFLRNPMGYVIIAAVLVIDGLLFNAFAVGSGQQRSSEVLENFFYFASGVNLVASIFVSMRLIAEEKQNGTLVLLHTSPIREWQVILGKYLSAMGFVALMTGLTFYMPALIFIHGKVSLGHIAAGYFGLLLITSAAIALALLASSLSPNQLVAAVLGAGFVLTFLLLWLLSRIASPPMEDLIAYLSLHDKHFRPFMNGIVSLQSVVFYASLTYLSLLIATRVLEARRWR